MNPQLNSYLQAGTDALAGYEKQLTAYGVGISPVSIKSPAMLIIAVIAGAAILYYIAK